MVRKRTLLPVLALLFLLLGLLLCRKWTNPYDPLANRPPSPPRLLYPDSGSRDIDTSVVLRWTCSDPDSLDTLKYILYLGISPPPPLFDSQITDTFYHPLNLNVLASYYWRIVARDRFGETATSPVWHFATARANNFPYVPSSPTPDSGAIGQFVRLTLSWAGGDPDPGDTVRYDIYFGTVNPPPLFVQGHPQTSWTPPRLKYDSTTTGGLSPGTNAVPRSAVRSGFSAPFHRLLLLSLMIPPAGGSIHIKPFAGLADHCFPQCRHQNFGPMWSSRQRTRWKGTG